MSFSNELTDPFLESRFHEALSFNKLNTDKLYIHPVELAQNAKNEVNDDDYNSESLFIEKLVRSKEWLELVKSSTTTIKVQKESTPSKNQYLIETDRYQSLSHQRKTLDLTV